MEGFSKMTLRWMAVLAGISLAGTFVLSHINSQSRRVRVHIATSRNQPEAEASKVLGFFHSACPDAIVIKDESRADYAVAALWVGGEWRVVVDGRDVPLIFHSEGSPDAIQTFRQTCAAIRDDANELADFNAHSALQPVGRYALQSVGQDRVFLMDTKTGAVWQLQQIGNSQEFDRVSVEGLYRNLPW